jgi:hypothetical protein
VPAIVEWDDAVPELQRLRFEALIAEGIERDHRRACA